MTLTKRQRQVYDLLVEFSAKNGYPPSLREIGDGLGLRSLATVHKHIANLGRKGLIRRDYNRSRSIEVVKALRGTEISRREMFSEFLSAYISREDPKFREAELILWSVAR